MLTRYCTDYLVVVSQLAIGDDAGAICLYPFTFD